MAVARVGSFSGASKAVGVTQSAITKSVADLEQQLGFAIFNRTSRGVAMTPEGRDFIDRAARLLADAADLFGERDRGADPFAGSGSTGVAALLEGRRFLGIEREADYVRIACDRLAALDGGWLVAQQAPKQASFEGVGA